MTESELLKQRTKKQDMTGKDVKQLLWKLFENISLIGEVVCVIIGVVSGIKTFFQIATLLAILYLSSICLRTIDESTKMAEEKWEKTAKLYKIRHWLENTRMRLDGMSREEVKESLDAAIKMLDE